MQKTRNGSLNYYSISSHHKKVDIISNKIDFLLKEMLHCYYNFEFESL